MIKPIVSIVCFFLFFSLSIFAQPEAIGKTKMKSLRGYIFYSLNYDSTLKRYIQKERYFIENFKDTFSILGIKNIDAIKNKFPKFRKKILGNTSTRFRHSIYEFYTLTHNDSLATDFLQGQFYEDSNGNLFLFGKIYIKTLVFYNPQDNIFKLIHGNGFNKPPFIHILKSKRKLQKANDYDLKKLGLKISNTSKIPFDL